MDRRSFVRNLGTAVIGISLVSIPQLEKKYILHGDGKIDDAEALQAWFHGKDVYYKDGSRVGNVLSNQTYLINSSVVMSGKVKHNQKLLMKNFELRITKNNSISIPDFKNPHQLHLRDGYIYGDFRHKYIG